MSDFLQLLTEVPIPTQQQQQQQTTPTNTQYQPPTPSKPIDPMMFMPTTPLSPQQPQQQQQQQQPKPSPPPPQQQQQQKTAKPTVQIPPQAPVLTKHTEESEKTKKKDVAAPKRIEFHEGDILKDSSVVITKYFIRKHSWRGKSIRSICFTDDKLITINPNTFEILSVWDFKDFVNVSPLIKSSEEFTISIRKSSGKIDKNTYSSNFRPYLLANLAQSLANYNPSKLLLLYNTLIIHLLIIINMLFIYYTYYTFIIH